MFKEKNSNTYKQKVKRYRKDLRFCCSSR